MGLRSFVSSAVSFVTKKVFGLNPIVALCVSLFLSWVLRPKDH